MLTITCELLHGVQVQVRSQGLVHKLNTSNHIVVIRCSVLVLHRLKDGQGFLKSVTCGPFHCLTLLAAVVEAVLGTWRTMEIDQHLQADGPRPVNGSIHEWSRAFDVWRVRIIVCPVTDGNSDQVEARIRDLLHILPGDPRLPMVLVNLVIRLLTQLLAHGILVYDLQVLREILED